MKFSLIYWNVYLDIGNLIKIKNLNNTDLMYIYLEN